MDARVVDPKEIAPTAEVLALAFHHDPVWGWVFADPERRQTNLTALWTLLLEGSVGYGWVWTTSEVGAATVWIPPGCPELPEPQEAQLEPMLQELVGARSTLVMEVFECFEAAHPRNLDHYYLSLLGTHPDHRGHGTGMALLADNLATVDAEGMPAYLESTNPVNLDRYRSVGFEVTGQFDLPEDGPAVTTMWREPR
jgi:GNAT superfamily N-acetyltransferase